MGGDKSLKTLFRFFLDAHFVSQKEFEETANDF
jgi:hypothetical protein